MRFANLLAAGCLIVALLPAGANADGGAVQALEQSGGLQIAVFTSPNPLLAGPVDLSVMVQDAQSLAAVDAEIDVAITPRERPYAAVQLPATEQAATNKLFRAVLVDLEPGWHDVEVRCRTAKRDGTVRFAMRVGAAPGESSILWPWYAWPAVPVVLFAAHRVYARSPRRRL